MHARSSRRPRQCLAVSGFSVSGYMLALAGAKSVAWAKVTLSQQSGEGRMLMVSTGATALSFNPPDMDIMDKMSRCIDKTWLLQVRNFIDSSKTQPNMQLQIHGHWKLCRRRHCWSLLLLVPDRSHRPPDVLLAADQVAILQFPQAVQVIFRRTVPVLLSYQTLPCCRS